MYYCNHLSSHPLNLITPFAIFLYFKNQLASTNSALRKLNYKHNQEKRKNKKHKIMDSESSYVFCCSLKFSNSSQIKALRVRSCKRSKISRIVNYRSEDILRKIYLPHWVLTRVLFSPPCLCPPTKPRLGSLHIISIFQVKGFSWSTKDRRTLDFHLHDSHLPLTIKKEVVLLKNIHFKSWRAWLLWKLESFWN